MSHRYRLCLVAFLLVGCAHGTTWRNPSLSPGQESADERACRRSAEEDMGPQAYSSPGSEKFDSPMQMVDRSEQRDHFDTLVSECMERKGYRRSE